MREPGSLPLPVGLVVSAPLLLFPNGVPRSRRWRWFLIVTAVAFTGLTIGSAVVAAPVASRTPLQLTAGSGVARSPSADLATGLSAIGWLLAFVSAAVAFSGVVIARRHERGDVRRQYTTVLVGVGALFVSVVASGVIGPLTGQREQAPEVVNAVFWLAIPTSVAVAVVRYRLYDLRVLISRSVLVVATGTVLTGAYLGVLVVAARVAGNATRVSSANLVAASAVGLLSVFAATGIAANTRRWFGRATDMHAVAARFDDGHQVDDDTAITLHRLAATVKDELSLGSVTLALNDTEPVQVGMPDGQVTRVTLWYSGRRAGDLVVTARRGESLSGRDRELLEQIARYVALTADAIRTNEELRTVQEALRNAHADERRRVRMDLHDGLGPTLAAIRLELVAYARGVPDRDPIHDLAASASDAIREVRRIVDGLQPSILEDLGLVPAVQILLADTSRTTGIRFSVDAPDDIEGLPTTIAATAYRTIAESIANVARHSGARTCQVSLRLSAGHLDTIVTDDGNGFDQAVRHGGMGLHSIRARARAVGGDATVKSTIGGTVVSAHLPLGIIA